jgi:hypothetical protein
MSSEALLKNHILNNYNLLNSVKIYDSLECNHVSDTVTELVERVREICEMSAPNHNITFLFSDNKNQFFTTMIYC